MQNKRFITVFTPTYNRVHLLERVYKSLVAQNYDKIEWLVVDDGSIDETKNWIHTKIAENRIPISYYYKLNGGKHTAVNLGVQKAKYDIFLLLDSDDYLSDNALEIINENWEAVEKHNLCGIAALSKFENGDIVGDRFLSEHWEIPFADIYLKYNLKGDKAVCFRTEILKNYPFPEKQGIPFVFEAVVWHEMSKYHNILCLNSIFQTVNYQSAGVSDSSYKLWYVRSLAFSYFHLIKNKTYSFSKYPKAFSWNFIHLGINSLLSKTSYFKQLNFKEKLIYLFFLPRAIISYRNMKKLLNDDK